MSLTGGAYSPEVRRHLDQPRNRGPIANANGVGTDENPVCGDVMTVWIDVSDGVIQHVGFEVRGCEPSIAAGSVLTEMVTGMTIDEVHQLKSNEIDARLGGLPRVKRHCAVLAARAATKAVDNYLQRMHT